MRPNSEKKMPKKRQPLFIIGLLIMILVILYFVFPGRIQNSMHISGRYGWEMLSILPAILILMGLADLWVPGQLVQKHLGQQSGLRGGFIAIILGTLPTGPLYIAFPVAAQLLHKKASLTNVIIFLGTWASLKIPQIGVELQFLGVKFTILRVSLTLIAVIGIGLITNFFAGNDVKDKLQES